MLHLAYAVVNANTEDPIFGANVLESLEEAREFDTRGRFMISGKHSAHGIISFPANQTQLCAAVVAIDSAGHAAIYIKDSGDASFWDALIEATARIIASRRTIGDKPSGVAIVESVAKWSSDDFATNIRHAEYIIGVMCVGECRRTCVLWPCKNPRKLAEHFETNRAMQRQVEAGDW